MNQIYPHRTGVSVSALLLIYGSRSMTLVQVVVTSPISAWDPMNHGFPISIELNCPPILVKIKFL